ncbi:Synaptobrevin/VAMP-like protein [Dioscorea alata]|uniref:Synaptobrevin/VAMP-like protein n=1 Tax=Dioscorea alata TaxID=55571 RepID=A0ACB7UCM2_DIOAL|nr:Synaptobrevin/VAMP-like protein [Dioscorea alata]
MASSESPPPPAVLYACVAHGSTILAELLFDHDADLTLDLDDPDLLSTAHRCLAAAPRYHRFYTHTARGRIHAFLIPDPDPFLLFFIIAHESFPRPEALLLLHRLRQAFLSSNVLLDSPSPHCLQNQLLPVFKSLLSPSDPPEETPSPPRSPSAEDALVADPAVDERIDDESKELKEKPMLKKKRSSLPGENRTTILVSDDDIGEQIGCLSFRQVKQARRVWERLVRVALIVDLVICSFLFLIWIMVCRGFKCLAA